MDVGVGTFASNAAMFFIILTTALTLHVHGLTHLETSAQVAEALRPLAGRFAALLYTVGLIGVGALAIPTLSGSAAYALAEVFSWREGIDREPKRAPAFYGVIVLSLVAGAALDFARVNPVKALYWTAVVNGVLAPFLGRGARRLESQGDARPTQLAPQPVRRLGDGCAHVCRSHRNVCVLMGEAGRSTFDVRRWELENKPEGPPRDLRAGPQVCFRTSNVEPLTSPH